jgi:hypothetical protein
VTLLLPGGVLVSAITPVQPPADADLTALPMVTRNDARQRSEIVELVAACGTTNLSQLRPRLPHYDSPRRRIPWFATTEICGAEVTA